MGGSWVGPAGPCTGRGGRRFCGSLWRRSSLPAPPSSCSRRQSALAGTPPRSPRLPSLLRRTSPETILAHCSLLSPPEREKGGAESGREASHLVGGVDNVVGFVVLEVEIRVAAVRAVELLLAAPVPAAEEWGAFGDCGEKEEEEEQRTKPACLL